MSLDDTSLREAFAALEGTTTEPPIEPERIWAAASGQLSDSETAAIVDRMARDPALAEEWRLARELGAAPPEVATLPRWRVAGIGLALAAAALLAVRAALPTDPVGPDPSEFRDGEPTVIESALPANTPLPRDAFTLKWTEVEPASVYTITISTADLSALDSSDLSVLSYTVPTQKLAGLSEGDLVLWQVTAMQPDGSEIRSSTFKTHLAD